MCLFGDCNFEALRLQHAHFSVRFGDSHRPHLVVSVRAAEQLLSHFSQSCVCPLLFLGRRTRGATRSKSSSPCLRVSWLWCSMFMSFRLSCCFEFGPCFVPVPRALTLRAKAALLANRPYCRQPLSHQFAYRVGRTKKGVNL